MAPPSTTTTATTAARAAENDEETGSSLASLCLVSKTACEIMAPMVRTFYEHCNGTGTAAATEKSGVKLKPDASVFTIADGVVQTLLVSHLFTGDRFASVVGEEDCGTDGAGVIITGSGPYIVDGLSVPSSFRSVIDECRRKMEALSRDIHEDAFRGLTVFIDPIDGTREFGSGKGEQCSICIGFSDGDGTAVAGVVYRPIDGTYAAGAASESFLETRLRLSTGTADGKKKFLTSNGAISPFLRNLVAGLGYEQIRSGGAGNKALMLLENQGAVYVQDRGVSRWDTCAAQAVLEANGGVLCKLSPFVAERGRMERYKYREGGVNSDFEPSARLTRYNCRDAGAVGGGDSARAGAVEEYKAYSNLCGLLAVGDVGEIDLDSLYGGVRSSCAAGFIPAYD